MEWIDQNLTKEVLLFCENSEASTKIHLMDVNILENPQGIYIIPLLGTNYISRVLLKVKNELIIFYGIANKEQKIFELNISKIFKDSN